MFRAAYKSDYSQLGYFLCSEFIFLRTVLLSFWVTASRLSQCFAMRNSVVFFTKTNKKARVSVLWQENSYLLYGENLHVRVSSTKATPPNSEIICGQNVGTKVVCGMILFFEKKTMLKNWKKLWVPFRSYLLNSTANPAHLSANGLDWLCYLAGNF